MLIAMIIGGYFAVGFVAAVVCVCCDVDEYHWKSGGATAATVFLWPIVGVIYLIAGISHGTFWLGKRCREARMRRKEKT